MTAAMDYERAISQHGKSIKRNRRKEWRPISLYLTTCIKNIYNIIKII